MFNVEIYPFSRVKFIYLGYGIGISSLPTSQGIRIPPSCWRSNVTGILLLPLGDIVVEKYYLLPVGGFSLPTVKILQ